MFKTILTSILTIFLIFNCNSQNKCNRSVDLNEYTKKLIKEVCIPKGYVIKLIYTETRNIDLDGDSLNDFIINYSRPELKEGDTSFVSMYKKINDSTFLHFKTFNNLYPAYFNSDGSPPQNEKLKTLYDCFDGRNPLLRLKFDSSRIELTLRIDAASGLYLKYKYSPKKRNWFLYAFQEWLEESNGEITRIDKSLPKKPESIDEFSYKKYLCN